MTDTFEREAQHAAPVAAGARRGAGAGIMAGSVLVAAALAVHPRGAGADLEFLQRVEDQPGLWLFGHALMAVGGLLLLLCLNAVPGLVPGRGRRVVVVGAGLAAVGAAATALGDFAHGALAYVLIGDVPIERSLDIQEQFYEQPLLAALTMPGLLMPIGLLVLGVGLLLSRAVPIAVAGLLVVAPVAVQVGFMATGLPMPVMVAPLVVGLGGVGLLVSRTPTRG